MPSKPVLLRELCAALLNTRFCFVFFSQEGAITPSDKTLFPDVDWLIGNHSDELTPWVPVIAAR